MAMRMPIPVKIREQLSEDPFMKECMVDYECDGRVEFDHAFKYTGKRVNEIWAILPLCTKHNHGVTSIVENHRKYWLRERIKHFHAEEEFRTKYPKSDLLRPTT